MFNADIIESLPTILLPTITLWLNRFNIEKLAPHVVPILGATKTPAVLHVYNN